MTSPLQRTLFGAWTWEPGVVFPLCAVIVAYALGVRALRANGAHTAVRPRDAAAFGAGCLAIAIALISPLDAISDQLFTAHMIQHELLMAVAPPLLVVSRAGPVLLWAFTRRVRKGIGRMLTSPPLRATWKMLVRPVDAWLIHGVAIWVWHVPRLFQAALGNDAVHALQHLSFFGSGLLFWWAMIHPPRKAALGMSIVFLFTTAVHTGALGALMTTARTPWYPAYGAGPGVWGLSILEDQQLAGLIMWIPASVIYLVAALIIFRRWISAAEQSDTSPPAVPAAGLAL